MYEYGYAYVYGHESSFSDTLERREICLRLKFLSDEWLESLNELRAAAGDAESPDLAGHVINVTVRRGRGDDVRMALVGGVLERGHRDGAPLTIILPADLARLFLIEGDQLAGMQGFMSGRIRIDGDARMLKALHAAPPSDAHLTMLRRLREITE